MDLLQLAGDLKSFIRSFEDLAVDATELSHIQTKSQLENACRALRRRDYTRLWQSAMCSSRLEQKHDAFQCDNLECGHYLCAECYATEVSTSADEQFHDPERLQRVTGLTCFYCRSGAMSSHICLAMPTSAFDIFRTAVEVQAQAEKARDATRDHIREVRRFRALPSSDEKLFKLEQDIIAELITIKCPTCMAPFGSFDACCSLTCTTCGSMLCALCLGGPFENDEIAHTHVAECKERPDCMFPGVFLDLDNWKQHIKRRQQKQIREYLDKTDLADRLKRRLMDFFSVP